MATKRVDPFFIDGLLSDEERERDVVGSESSAASVEKKREVIHEAQRSTDGRQSRTKRARCAFVDDMADGPSASDEDEGDEEALTPGFIATQTDDGAVSSAEMRGIYGRSLLSQSPMMPTQSSGNEQSTSQASANDGEHELVRFALANGFASFPLASLRSTLHSFVGIFGESEHLTVEFCGTDFLEHILGSSKSKRVDSSPLYCAPASPTSPSYTPTSASLSQSPCAARGAPSNPVAHRLVYADSDDGSEQSQGHDRHDILRAAQPARNCAAWCASGRRHNLSPPIRSPRFPRMTT
jgi:hypothetical protein